MRRKPGSSSPSFEPTAAAPSPAGTWRLRPLRTFAGDREAAGERTDLLYCAAAQTLSGTATGGSITLLGDVTPIGCLLDLIVGDGQCVDEERRDPRVTAETRPREQVVQNVVGDRIVFSNTLNARRIL